MNHIVNKRTKGILLLILSAFFFACMNMFVKLSGEELPVFQKVFFRNAMAAVIAFIVLLKNKAPLKPSVKGSLPFLILRTLFGLMGVVCNYYALETLVHEAGGKVVGKMAVLAEGDATTRKDILYLEKLPLFNAEGKPID